MPRLAESAVPVPASLTRMAAPTAPATPPLPESIARSPVMLASLPGIGSGPDAVLRQFLGGRIAPQTRLLVP